MRASRPRSGTLSMKLFRKILFWCHLTAGLVAGVVIFIMSVTGALLSFQPQIEEFTEREARFVVISENAQRLDAQTLLEQVLVAKPDLQPTNLTVYGEANKAVALAVGREGNVYVNPYTGEITGESAKTTRAFFRTTTDWHRWLAADGDNRPIARAVTGACNLAFLFLAISGVYIWFPRKWSWRHFKAVMMFRPKLKGKARDFNWHNTIGFWTSLVLIILTVTAAVISYNWARDLLYTMTGNEPPRPAQRVPQPNSAENKKEPFAVPANINALWERAEAQAPQAKFIALRLPLEKEAAFTIDEGKSWNPFGRSRLTLDAETTEVTTWEAYNDQNAGRQLQSWFRFTHTGESFGIVGQTIGFLACIGGAFLVWTGFSLAWRRFWRWRKKGDPLAD